MSWLYIFTASIRVYDSFSFLANSLMSSMNNRWLIFTCIRQCISWVCGCVASSLLQIIMVIVHLPGIYLSGSLLQLSLAPTAVNSTLRVFMVFSIKFMTLCDILNVLRHFITLSIHAIDKFFRLVLLSLKRCWSMQSGSPVLLLPLQHPFSSLQISQRLIPIYPTPPLGQDMRQAQFFKAEFNWFEFRVCLLIDKLHHQGWRNRSLLLFTHSWRENNWIHTFPKGISTMWNAISLVQDLNSCRRVHFLRR